MTGEGLEGMFHHVSKHREEMWAGSGVYLVIFFFFNYGESGGKKIVISVLIKIRYPNTVTVMMLTNVLSVSPWNRQGYFLSHSYGSLILFAMPRRR